MDTEGAITFRALTAKGYKELKAQLRKEYVTQGKAWLAARNKAQEAGEEFTEPKPVKPRYKALERISTKAVAEKLAAKYQRKYEELKRQKDKEEAKASQDTT
ncbi:MAG: hypothetical protein ACODAJ_06690 [Planctomycetota bacterium]